MFHYAPGAYKTFENWNTRFLPRSPTGRSIVQQHMLHAYLKYARDCSIYFTKTTYNKKGAFINLGWQSNEFLVSPKSLTPYLKAFRIWLRTRGKTRNFWLISPRSLKEESCLIRRVAAFCIGYSGELKMYEFSAGTLACRLIKRVDTPVGSYWQHRGVFFNNFEGLLRL